MKAATKRPPDPANSYAVSYRAEPLALATDASAAHALLAILGNCLEHIQHNERGVIETGDAEALHQMRVGMRRLRSALKLFERVVSCPDAVLQDVAWLGSILGAARDADVLLTSTLERVHAYAGGVNELQHLQALVQADVRDKRQAAAQALQSKRHQRMLKSLDAWVHQLAADPPKTLSLPAASFARKTMQRLHKKMLKRADRMDDHHTASLHRTRIAAKRSRYALEFFHALFRTKGAQAYLKTVSAIQDELGQHNDLVVADRVLQTLEAQHAEAAGAIGFVRGYLAALQTQQALDLDGVTHRLHALALPRAH